eukprot:COSAG05_NODE_1608_length_4413_cov_6.524108_3_plen_100_part_00
MSQRLSRDLLELYHRTHTLNSRALHLCQQQQQQQQPAQTALGIDALNEFKAEYDAAGSLLAAAEATLRERFASADAAGCNSTVDAGVLTLWAASSCLNI